MDNHNSALIERLRRGDLIDEMHPCENHSHRTSDIAREIVGHHHGKGELVQAVNVLLQLALRDTAASPTDGFLKAFYEIAAMMNFGARTQPPAFIWEHEMKPKLRAIIEAHQARPTPDVSSATAGVRAIGNSAPAGTRFAVNGLPAPTPVSPLARYTEFNAYRANDPLAIRLVFATPEDRLAAAEAIDTIASTPPHDVRRDALEEAAKVANAVVKRICDQVKVTERNDGIRAGAVEIRDTIRDLKTED